MSMSEHTWVVLTMVHATPDQASRVSSEGRGVLTGDEPAQLVQAFCHVCRMRYDDCADLACPGPIPASLRPDDRPVHPSIPRSVRRRLEREKRGSRGGLVHDGIGDVRHIDPRSTYTNRSRQRDEAARPRGMEDAPWPEPVDA